jgi:hypothetical protein
MAHDYERVFSLFSQLASGNSNSAELSGGEQSTDPALGAPHEPRGSASRRASMGLLLCSCGDLQVLTDINWSGTTILLVEQNARMALGIASSWMCWRTADCLPVREDASRRSVSRKRTWGSVRLSAAYPATIAPILRALSKKVVLRHVSIKTGLKARPQAVFIVRLSMANAS